MKNLLSGLGFVCCLVLLAAVYVLPVFAADATSSGQGTSEGASCERIKISLQRQAGRLIQKATLYKAVYDKAAENNDKHIDPDLLLTKHSVLETALATAKTDLVKLACPVETLRATVQQEEKDLREVNNALTDYRRTLMGLTGKPERIFSSAVSTVLGAQTKKNTCTEDRVVAKKQAMTKLVTTAEKLEAKYAFRAKVTGALPTAIVQTKRLAFESALAKAKQDISMVLCVEGSMENSVRTFKTDMQTALVALKAYRQSLQDSAPDSQQSDLEKDAAALAVVQ